MSKEGPVLRVLRADVEFEKLRAKTHKWNGYRHDLAMGALCLFTASGFLVVLNPWALLVSVPMFALVGYLYSYVTRRYHDLVDETEEAFTEYRAVLENSISREFEHSSPPPQDASALQH